MPKPSILEILKLLPKTNCRECGQATCMVFAVRTAEGVTGSQDCPHLSKENAEKLATYLDEFPWPIIQL